MKSYFNRTFNYNKYFYCKACKKIFLTEQNLDMGNNDTGPCFLVSTPDNTTTSKCSFLDLSYSVVYPGNIDTNPNITSEYGSCYLGLGVGLVVVIWLIKGCTIGLAARLGLGLGLFVVVSLLHITYVVCVLFLGVLL